MVICKYFMQGNCRFGDRCRFDHPRGNSGYNSRNDGGFDLRDRINSKSQDDYGHGYSQRGSVGFSGSQNQSYGQGSQRYNNRNSNYYQTQNRFQTLSDHGGFGGSKQLQNQVEPTAQEVVQAISQDMEEWEKSQSMWLFSCYTFTKEKPSMPDIGLDDISPEEVRLKAYEAEASGNHTQYKNWFYQTRNDYVNRRKELVRPNVTFKVKLVEIIDNVLKSSKSSDSSTSTSSFGSSTTSGGFGSSNTPSSFGGGIGQTGLFSTQSTFGGTQSTGLFGKPAPGDTSGSIFGGGATTGGTSFGGGASTGTGFGDGASTGTGFGGGASTGSGFGGGASTGTGFGGVSTSTGFGGTAMASTGFGGGSTTSTGFAGGATQSSGLFGKPTTTGTGGSIFGGAAQSQSSSAGLFGNPTSSQSSPGVFGNTTATVLQPNPSAALFGGVSNPVAGSSTSAFAQPTSQGFGGTTSSQQSLFTTSSSQQPSAFSSTNPSSGFGGFGQIKSQTQGSTSTGQSKSSQYTPLDQLTADERRAFEAPKFVLGKIPTRPPPRELV